MCSSSGRPQRKRSPRLASGHPPSESALGGCGSSRTRPRSPRDPWGRWVALRLRRPPYFLRRWELPAPRRLPVRHSHSHSHASPKKTKTLRFAGSSRYRHGDSKGGAGRLLERFSRARAEREPQARGREPLAGAPSCYSSCDSVRIASTSLKRSRRRKAPSPAAAWRAIDSRFT